MASYVKRLVPAQLHRQRQAQYDLGRHLPQCDLSACAARPVCAAQRARRSDIHLSGGRCLGAVLLGWGIFNLVEGVVDHEIFKLHRVNETVPDEQRIFWDIGFLLWGAAMLVIGAAMTRAATQARVHAESSLQAR